MNVLSLFNGMSCGMLALLKAGKKVDNYFSSEIDKHANKASKVKFPNIIHLGSVVDVDVNKLPIIDLVIAGSPCQGFSNAGKGLNFNDPRSRLFFEFVRILKQCREKNPGVLFLLENVRMKKEWEDIISRLLEIQPILINSALVSAQNRERLYWTNIAMQKQGLFGDNVCIIPQPEDKKIFLKDILQPPEEVDEKYYLKEATINSLLKHKEKHKEKGNGFGASFKEADEKSNCISARYNKDGAESLIVEPTQAGCVKFGRTEEAKEIRKKNMSKGKDYTPFANKKITGVDYEKMNTLVTNSSKDNLIIYPEHPIVHNMQPRSGDPAKGGTGHLTRSDVKTYCLDTGNTNAVEVTEIREVRQLNTSNESNGCQPFQHKRVYDINGIAPAVCSQMSGGGNQILLENRRIRRLTPIEVCRLQTVPDDFFFYPLGHVPRKGAKKAKGDDGSLDLDDTYNPGVAAGNPVKVNGELRFQIVSDSQIYKMCGNGWNVDTIVHIFSFLP